MIENSAVSSSRLSAKAAVIELEVHTVYEKMTAQEKMRHFLRDFEK